MKYKFIDKMTYLDKVTASYYNSQGNVVFITKNGGFYNPVSRVKTYISTQVEQVPVPKKYVRWLINNYDLFKYFLKGIDIKRNKIYLGGLGGGELKRRGFYNYANEKAMLSGLLYRWYDLRMTELGKEQIKFFVFLYNNFLNEVLFTNTIGEYNIDVLYNFFVLSYRLLFHKIQEQLFIPKEHIREGIKKYIEIKTLYDMGIKNIDGMIIEDDDIKKIKEGKYFEMYEPSDDDLNKLINIFISK